MFFSYCREDIDWGYTLGTVVLLNVLGTDGLPGIIFLLVRSDFLEIFWITWFGLEGALIS